MKPKQMFLTLVLNKLNSVTLFIQGFITTILNADQEIRPCFDKQTNKKTVNWAIDIAIIAASLSVFIDSLNNEFNDKLVDLQKFLRHIYIHEQKLEESATYIPKSYHCSHYLVTKSYPILCKPMDCSPPGSSVHEISQARILQWVAISFSKKLSQLTAFLNPAHQTIRLCLYRKRSGFWPELPR